MKRRDFVQLTGLGFGGMLLPLPIIGNPVPIETLLDSPLTITQKKELADIALNAAKSLGATYKMYGLAATSTNFLLRGKIKYKIL